jgi:hypothetical protein
MDREKRVSRYTTPRGAEAQYQPGSGGRVLVNRLGIRRQRDMDRAEYEALLRAQNAFVDVMTAETRFTAELVRQMHRGWLGGSTPGRGSIVGWMWPRAASGGLRLYALQRTWPNSSPDC